MSVKLENVDALRKRTKVSYETAREALEKCNDDLLEAIIYLEKQNLINKEHCEEKKNSFWSTIKRIIKKGNSTMLIIKNKENIILSIPVTAVVILTLIAPYVSVIVLLVVLLTGHRIKFQGKNGDCTQVNDMLNKVADTVEDTKRKLVEDDSCNSTD